MRRSSHSVPTTSMSKCWPTSCEMHWVGPNLRKGLHDLNRQVRAVGVQASACAIANADVFLQPEGWTPTVRRPVPFYRCNVGSSHSAQSAPFPSPPSSTMSSTCSMPVVSISKRTTLPCLMVLDRQRCFPSHRTTNTTLPAVTVGHSGLTCQRFPLTAQWKDMPGRRVRVDSVSKNLAARGQ